MNVVLWYCWNIFYVKDYLLAIYKSFGYIQNYVDFRVHRSHLKINSQISFCIRDIISFCISALEILKFISFSFTLNLKIKSLLIPAILQMKSEIYCIISRFFMQIRVQWPGQIKKNRDWLYKDNTFAIFLSDHNVFNLLYIIVNYI